MIRKRVLALGAIALIGAAALTPTVASAHRQHHWFRGRIGISPNPSPSAGLLSR